jgi:hypothetical protein
MSLRTQIARNRIAGMVLAALLLPLAANAAEITTLPLSTGELADLCGTDPSTPAGIASVNFCHGFAQGVLTVLERQVAAGGRQLVCYPSPAPTRGATLDAFVEWVKLFPDNRSKPVLDGLLGFLTERYPCNR